MWPCSLNISKEPICLQSLPAAHHARSRAGAVQGCGEPDLQAPLQKRAPETIADNDPDATPTAKRHRPDGPVSESPCADAVMRCLDRAERGGAACSTTAQPPEPSIAAADATVDLTADTSDDDGTVIEATVARPAWFVPPGVLTLESASPSVLLLLDEEGGNDRCSLEGDEPVSEETLSLPAAAVAREPSYEENPYNSLNGTVFLKVFLERYNWD